MKRFFFYILFFLLSIAYCKLYSQTNNIVPVSPEAAALAKMVNYSINQNTGVPDINIPFYEIKVGGMSLPITLNYHAGGFKINEQSTRTGLGWSLSSDIQITRTINGKDDFSLGGYLGNTFAKTYYPGSPSYPIWSVTPFPYYNAYYLAVGEVDGMPDKYNYKLLTKSGSFYFQKNNSGNGYIIVPVPFDNIKIEYVDGAFFIIDTDGTAYYFGEAGGGRDKGALLSRGIEVSNSNMPTTWKCKRIVSNNKVDEITFSYGVKNIAGYSSFTDKVEYFNNESPCAMDGYFASDQFPIVAFNNYETVIGQIPFHQISSPKYKVSYGYSPFKFHIPFLDGSNNIQDKVLTEDTFNLYGTSDVTGLSVMSINFRGGRVDFNGANQLNTITVRDNHNNEIKSLRLFQSFKQANYPEASKFHNGSNFQGTMYLDSLHLKNGNNVFERYALVYNDKYCYGNHLKGHDAWGYPNATTMDIEFAKSMGGELLSLPTKTITQSRFYFNVSFWNCNNFVNNVPIKIQGTDNAAFVDELALQRGILKRIVYPTGGYVDFDYEANKFEDNFSNPQALPYLGGGLRIRSINYYDENDSYPKMQKYYRYGEFEGGTGILLNRPTASYGIGVSPFGASSYEQDVVYLKGWDSGAGGAIDRTGLTTLAVEKKTTYLPASSLDYTYSSGAAVYYTKVTEYQQNLGLHTGKTVYEYYAPDHFYGDLSAPYRVDSRLPNTNIPYLKTDGLMGQQKAVTEYKFQSDLSYKPLHRKKFEYERYLKTEQVSVAYSFFKVLYQLVEGSFLGNDHDYYNNAYSISGYSTNSEYYAGEYGIPVGKLLLTKIEEAWFEEEGPIVTTTTFDYDNLPYLQASSVSVVDSKGQKNVKEFKYAYDFNGVAVYDEMVVSNMIIQEIEQIETNTTLGLELSRKKTNFASWPIGWGVIAPVSIQSSVKGEPLETDVNFDQYDEYGNLLQLRKKDNIPISYLWGYNSLYPVAELKGVAYSTIPLSFIANGEIINPSSDMALRTQLATLRGSFYGENEVKSFTFKRLIGMSSETAPNGRNSYYNYDNIGRMAEQRDHDQNIVNIYNYNMKGPSSRSLHLHFANIPVMRTHHYECAPGVLQTYNYFVPGGKYFSLTQSSADLTAEHEAAQAINFIPWPACPPSSKSVSVWLVGLYDELAPVPTQFEVDLIKDDAVVATYRLKNDIEMMRFPVGEYKVSVRVKSMNHSFYHMGGYRFLSFNDNVDVNFNSGFTINLVEGDSYVIECKEVW